MTNAYDDSKFGVIQRTWFGLTGKWGGEGVAYFQAGTIAVGGAWGTTDNTSATLLQGWYPKGPIKMLKFGRMVLATMTNGSNDLFPVYLKTRGASGSAAATLYIKSTSTAVAPRDIASTTTFTVSQVKAGEYVYIRCGTPCTDKGTAGNTATTTGTVAFFIDWIPTYSSKWDT